MKGWSAALAAAGTVAGCTGVEAPEPTPGLPTTVSAEGGEASSTQPADSGETSAPQEDGGDSSSTGGSSGQGSTGPQESCSDEVLNGSETDVDCGGECEPCDEGAGCLSAADCVSANCEAGSCGPAFSCREIKEGRPDAETGPYTIYPDGGATAIDVWCDMDRAGGGWTLTFAADGVSFAVGHAVPSTSTGSLPDLFTASDARYTQYAAHTEEMFVCTTGEGETPNYEVRTFEFVPRFWDQSLDNAEIFVTGTQGTPNASATEYCADLVWGGCNLQHYGYAVYNSAFGSANWGRWSGNTVYGPKGGDLNCFANGDQTDNPAAWFWHFVR